MMLGVDPGIGISALRLWLAAGSAALLAAGCILAFILPSTRRAATTHAGFLVLGAVLGAATIWAFAPAGKAGAERRALEMQAQELAALALAPNSPLACLDPLTGESVEAACEREIFASPARVAAAISYTAARLAVFSDLSAYGGSGAQVDDALASLRRSLEADRFGFLAHVLMIEDGCTPAHCKVLMLLRDSGQVRANLRDAAFDRYLGRHLPSWAESWAESWAKLPAGTPAGATAQTTEVRPSAAAQSAAHGPHALDIDFPTAASIPPVTIMSPEPKGPVLPGATGAAAANSGPPGGRSASWRSRRQPAKQSAAAAAAVEPIWPEPVPLAPASTARGQ